MCRGDWKTHGQHTGGFYSCNKYDKSEGKKKDDEAANLRSAAERFQHYWDRCERLENFSLSSFSPLPL